MAQADFKESNPEYLPYLRTGLHEHPAIAARVRHLDFRQDLIADGHKPQILLEENLACEDGRVIRGLGCLAQSVTLLSNPMPNQAPGRVSNSPAQWNVI